MLNTLRALTLMVMLFAVYASFAFAGSQDTLSSLGETVSLWEGQAAKGNAPSAEYCKYMREQLEKAREELTEERKAYFESLDNPPTVENGDRSVVTSWVRLMRRTKRGIDKRERQLKDLAARIAALCPSRRVLPPHKHIRMHKPKHHPRKRARLKQTLVPTPLQRAMGSGRYRHIMPWDTADTPRPTVGLNWYINPNHRDLPTRPRLGVEIVRMDLSGFNTGPIVIGNDVSSPGDVPFQVPVVPTWTPTR